MNHDTIGIDISKDKLDVHRLLDGRFAQFPNTKPGFKALQKWVGAILPACVVYEPTGAYHGAFEAALADHLPLVKVNPKHARRFAESRGAGAKTDRADARSLAQMGAAHGLAPDTPAAKDRPVLRELQSARTALVKDKVRLRNQLDKQGHALTRKLSSRRLRLVEAQIAELDQAIRAQIETCPVRKRALTLMESIKGIGAVAATTILIELPEIGSLRKKAVAAIAGVAPITRQSGRWRGQAFIQGGRKPLRDALYMPALVAIRFNPDLKAQYDKMKAAGKPPKVAIIAVMRKLLILANTLVREDREWSEIKA
ncbi:MULTISPECIES: IS110 family transposase [Roseobacteraceae]|uniref:Transposase n=1 Tax=Pseudosulfitobacter pseudonitzschiae TaxID=1402135 RepID=A0A221JXN4_9RHOB|nr:MULTISPECIES: transposase [Roseobacteraceae]ASM71511.1 transposase [Pseudosulfitobacter pseudonitzschiae]